MPRHTDFPASMPSSLPVSHFALDALRALIIPPRRRWMALGAKLIYAALLPSHLICFDDRPARRSPWSPVSGRRRAEEAARPRIWRKATRYPRPWRRQTSEAATLEARRQARDSATSENEAWLSSSAGEMNRRGEVVVLGAMPMATRSKLARGRSEGTADDGRVVFCTRAAEDENRCSACAAAPETTTRSSGARAFFAVGVERAARRRCADSGC